MCPSLRFLFRSTEQEARGFMVVQVLTIQSVRNDAKVLAMYVSYLAPCSSEAKNLKSQSHRLVEQSGERDEYSSSRHSGDTSNDCHQGLSEAQSQ